MPIAYSSLVRRSGQPGAVLRARLRGCSRPRTEAPGCAAAPGAQGDAVPLINVEHNDDGTSSYTFGESNEAPTGLDESSSDSQSRGSGHQVEMLEPSIPHTDAAEQSEPQLSIGSSERHIQQQNDPALNHSLDGSITAETGHTGASEPTSGDGPLAGIPPPRRSYIMPTPRELQDQLDSVTAHIHSSQTHVDVPDSTFRDSRVDDAAHQDTERLARSGTEGDAAARSKSRPSQGFKKMSHLGQAFCQALSETNLMSAVAIAHAIEEHGTEADCKVLAGPKFFRKAGELGDTSAILSFLHALPPSTITPFTYQHAITACRSLDDVPATLSVLELMYDRGTPPDSHHCSNALAVCKAGGDVEQAFVWFSRMTAAGTSPDAHMLAGLAAACSSRIRTLRAAHKSAHSCDDSSGNQGQRRQQLVLADRAVGLLNLLPQTGKMADTALWNSILECVAFSGQLTRALQLLDDMSSAGCQPDSRSFVALLTACTTEGEQAVAQKVYRAAKRSRCGTLRVHTAALGICLIKPGNADTRAENLALAIEIHRDVMNSGMRQDTVYKNKLIAAAGCSGDLDFALETLEELQSSPQLAVTPETARAVTRACIACGQPARAFIVYKQFIADGVVPGVKCANQIMDAFAAQGDMHSAVDVLETIVAAGVVPESGTVAALIGGCQRRNYFELAFQVAQVSVSRGIAIDGTIGYLLLKTCYTSIRALWVKTHAQIAAQRASGHESEPEIAHAANRDSSSSASRHSPAGAPAASSADASASAAEDAAAEASEKGLWAERMLHALTGLGNVPVVEEGVKNVREWRDRAHLVYRDLVDNKVPITPRILERAIACMMLDVSRREKARTPQPHLAAPGLPPPPPPDPACTVIARLDGRFDPRAYKYVDDGAAAGRLPSTAVTLGGRAVDLRGHLPATVEAFVLQLFHTLFRHLRGERGGVTGVRASGSLALIVPPFRQWLVNTPSTQSERKLVPRQTDDSALVMSQSDDDQSDDAISSPFQTSDRVSLSSRILRLQRQHAVDLSAVGMSNLDDGTSLSKASGVRGELVGFAAASALRSLKVPHTVEEASGVLICDAEDLSAWAHRRHIELLTRLQQRRRRRKTEAPVGFTQSSDSEADMDPHMPPGLQAKTSWRDMSGDLSSGSLTPGLSGRGAQTVSLGGGLGSHTSTLRASSLQAQPSMQAGAMPDSKASFWDDRVSHHASHSSQHDNPVPQTLSMPADPVSGKKNSLGLNSKPAGSVEELGVHSSAPEHDTQKRKVQGAD